MPRYLAVLIVLLMAVCLGGFVVFQSLARPGPVTEAATVAAGSGGPAATVPASAPPAPARATSPGTGETQETAQDAARRQRPRTVMDALRGQKGKGPARETGEGGFASRVGSFSSSCDKSAGAKFCKTGQ